VTVSVAPSNVPEQMIPRVVMAAVALGSFQCPYGARHTTRAPRGPPERVRVMLVAAPNSSKNKRRSGRTSANSVSPVADGPRVRTAVLGGVQRFFEPPAAPPRRTPALRPAAAASSASAMSGGAAISAASRSTLPTSSSFEVSDRLGGGSSSESVARRRGTSPRGQLSPQSKVLAVLSSEPINS
jgi:hypothetical protein